MIRYFTSHSTICRISPGALTVLVSPIQRAYRELLQLREQVKAAQAAANRPRAHDKLKTCARPAARLVTEANRAAVQGIHQEPALRHVR